MKILLIIIPLLLMSCEPKEEVTTKAACPDCKTSATGKALIRQYEGLKLKCYLDAAGYWTVGYGHKLDHKSECPLKPLTLKEAENLLLSDIAIAERGVQRLVSVPLTQGQYDALVSFAYNLGVGALGSSTLLKLVNQKNHKAAKAEFPRWIHAGGKVLVGLRIRRSIEAFLYANV